MHSSIGNAGQLHVAPAVLRDWFVRDDRSTTGITESTKRHALLLCLLLSEEHKLLYQWRQLAAVDRAREWLRCREVAAAKVSVELARANRTRCWYLRCVHCSASTKECQGRQRQR